MPGNPGALICRNRDILAWRYHADLRVYADVARSLVLAVGANFAEALNRANRARLVFERARDQLNKHLSEHHCSGE
jgi:hypothetical protein